MPKAPSAPPADKSAAEVVELVEIAKGDANLAALAAVADRHFGAERQPKLVLKRARVGIHGFSSLSRPCCLARILAEALDVADGQALGDDAVGERVRVGDGEQRARVPGRNLSAREQAAGVFGQIRQAQGVGDVAPAFADDSRNVGVRIAIIGAELRVSGGFFERVQVGPLHVFDDGDFERFAVAASTIVTGISCSPARCAARQRRSPAMIRKGPPRPKWRARRPAG